MFYAKLVLYLGLAVGLGLGCGWKGKARTIGWIVVAVSGFTMQYLGIGL